ncbi:hypothetical protein JC221_204 [Yersinia phage JC221]|nr:hypothetical protein JC221_204 [Yersinia phage JC221]
MEIANIRFSVEFGDFYVHNDGTIWLDSEQGLIRDMWVWEIISTEMPLLYDKFVKATENCNFDLSFEDFKRIMRKLKTAYELMD